MVKKVHNKIGLETALVVLGWIAFIAGFFISDPLSNITLQTIARVLP